MAIRHQPHSGTELCPRCPAMGGHRGESAAATRERAFPGPGRWGCGQGRAWRRERRRAGESGGARVPAAATPAAGTGAAASAAGRAAVGAGRVR